MYSLATVGPLNKIRVPARSRNLRPSVRAISTRALVLSSSQVAVRLGAPFSFRCSHHNGGFSHCEIFCMMNSKKNMLSRAACAVASCTARALCATQHPSLHMASWWNSILRPCADTMRTPGSSASFGGWCVTTYRHVNMQSTVPQPGETIATRVSTRHSVFLGLEVGDTTESEKRPSDE